MGNPIPGQGQQVNVVIQGIDEFSEIAKKLQGSLEGFYRLGEGDTRDAIARMQEFAKAVTSVAQSLKNPATGLVGSLTGFTIAAGMASAAFAGLVHSISGFAEHEGSLARMSKQLGVAREQLLAMDVVGKATGVDLLRGLEAANRKMQEFNLHRGNAREWFAKEFLPEDRKRVEEAAKRSDLLGFMDAARIGIEHIAPQFRSIATAEIFNTDRAEDFLDAMKQMDPELVKRLQNTKAQAKANEELEQATRKLRMDYAVVLQQMATATAPTVLNVLKEVLHLLHDPIDESWQRWFGSTSTGPTTPAQMHQGLGQGALTQFQVQMGGPRINQQADSNLQAWLQRGGKGGGQPQVPQSTQDTLQKAVREGTKEGAKDAEAAKPKGTPSIGDIISGGASGVWEWLKKNFSPISAAGAATMPGGPGAGAGAGAGVAGSGGAGMTTAANAAAAMTQELFQRDPGLSGQTTTYSSSYPSATPGGGGGGDSGGGASGMPRRPGGPGGTVRSDGADQGSGSVIPELGANIKEALVNTGKAQGIDPTAIASMITVEDPSWKPGVTGGAGGRYMGLTQVGPDTLREMGVTPQQYLSMTAEQQIQFYSRWLDHYHFKEKLAAAGIDMSKLSPAEQAAILQAMQFHPNQRGGSATTPPDWMVEIGKGNWNTIATTSKQWGPLGKSLDDYRNFFKSQQANTVRARQAATGTPGTPAGVGTGAADQVMPVTGHVTGLLGDPRSGGRRQHAGVDIGAPEGSAVSATVGGRVLSAEWHQGYGWTVDVQRSDGTVDRYAHLSSMAVAKGDTVQPGSSIGRVGHTGSPGIGPHLHYEHRQRADYGFRGLFDPAKELGINRDTLVTRLNPIPHDSAELARRAGTPEKKGSVDIEVKVGGNDDLKQKRSALSDDPYYRDYRKDDKQQNVGAQ
jgi:murein DD-endopeptidase MepM/ murein hydrolase activator NlpD